MPRGEGYIPVTLHRLCRLLFPIRQTGGDDSVHTAFVHTFRTLLHAKRCGKMLDSARAVVRCKASHLARHLSEGKDVGL